MNANLTALCSIENKRLQEALLDWACIVEEGPVDWIGERVASISGGLREAIDDGGWVLSDSDTLNAFEFLHSVALLNPPQKKEIA